MTDLFKALLTTDHTATVLTNLTSNIGVTLIRFDKVPDQYPTQHKRCINFAVNELGVVLAVGPTQSKVLATLEEDFGLKFAEAD
jgi:hypothetical protein